MTLQQDLSAIYTRLKTLESAASGAARKDIARLRADFLAVSAKIDGYFVAHPFAVWASFVACIAAGYVAGKLF
ncbi:MAG: hypothetical protein QJR02_07170 [Sinobacteraceae bacterium]|nr:hypothetical protein [Nevskiaceae bacterium]